MESSTKLITEMGNEEESLINALESLLEEYKQTRPKSLVPQIPLSSFSEKELGVLEILVKVLKENYSLGFCDIARLLATRLPPLAASQ